LGRRTPVSRGGGSPELADLGRPGSVLDEVWPGSKLSVCVKHLGGWHGSGGRVGAAALAAAHAFGYSGSECF
jgi:hypothetical protein